MTKPAKKLCIPNAPIKGDKPERPVQEEEILDCFSYRTPAKVVDNTKKTLDFSANTDDSFAGFKVDTTYSMRRLEEEFFDGLMSRVRNVNPAQLVPRLIDTLVNYGILNA
ncbi:MAG: hypothetical protein K0U52_10080 [Gammaproteobacteria bacterium]|nr:hypothetical protein [Gammaproteobacteria bacterium]